MPETPYRSYSRHLEEKYGERVYRVGVDAGFSCPNRHGADREGGCVYCDSKGAKAQYLRASESGFRHDSSFEKDIDTMRCSAFDLNDIRSQVEKGLAFLSSRYKARLFSLYLQSYSNTFAPLAALRQVYDAALGSGDWTEFIVSTRPDCLSDEKLDLLASYMESGRVRNVCLELGLQSGDDGILEAMNRGHDVACLEKWAAKAKGRGIEVCLHILTGFPGEGIEQLDRTIEVVNRVHPDAIKIHNLNICAGTPLFDRYLEGEVTAPSMTRHIETVVRILRRIAPDIVIQRLMAETPSHRLAAPRNFPDKNVFLRKLEERMKQLNCVQGDLYSTPQHC